MKTLLRSLALVALGALMVYGIGIAAEGAGAPAAAEKPCAGCPHASGDDPGAPPMMEKMKAHLEGMKKALAGLRESEKTLAGTEDPKAFRAAVVEHLKKLDDLQASHLAHMEQMMGRMHGGMPGMGHGHGADCRCADCGCKDCRGKDCGHRGDCCCHSGCDKGGGHAR